SRRPGRRSPLAPQPRTATGITRAPGSTANLWTRITPRATTLVFSGGRGKNQTQMTHYFIEEVGRPLGSLAHDRAVQSREVDLSGGSGKTRARQVANIP